MAVLRDGVHTVVRKMTSGNTAFWLSLLEEGESREQRTGLWNGYIGWRLAVDTGRGLEGLGYESKPTIQRPADGWPDLSIEEKESLEAGSHGGHPEFGSKCMDFRGHEFDEEVDFSDLVLINSDFDGAQFDGTAYFRNARFHSTASFHETRFKGHAFFEGVEFDVSARFMGTEFWCGCSFRDARFGAAWCNDARFFERGFPSNMIPVTLVNFANAKFTSVVDFREAVFGDADPKRSRTTWPERVVDFSGSRFEEQASFYKATFGSAPAFFDTDLHADTNFDGVHWEQGGGDRVSPGYAVRAWERLELIMSQLEKPLDRHRFFRLKMRYRRRIDGPLLRVLNKLFEMTCDYGWGVQRAFCWWIGHWIAFALVLFLNTGLQTGTRDSWELARAALGVGFANGHAFLGLAKDGGYLESSRRLLESNDVWGLLSSAGTVQAVLGPKFLFLVLLTLRNRFRLA